MVLGKWNLYTNDHMVMQMLYIFFLYTNDNMVMQMLYIFFPLCNKWISLYDINYICLFWLRFIKKIHNGWTGAS